MTGSIAIRRDIYQAEREFRNFSAGVKKTTLSIMQLNCVIASSSNELIGSLIGIRRETQELGDAFKQLHIEVGAFHRSIKKTLQVNINHEKATNFSGDNNKNISKLPESPSASESKLSKTINFIDNKVTPVLDFFNGLNDMKENIQKIGSKFLNSKPPLINTLIAGSIPMMGKHSSFNLDHIMSLIGMSMVMAPPFFTKETSALPTPVFDGNIAKIKKEKIELQEEIKKFKVKEREELKKAALTNIGASIVTTSSRQEIRSREERIRYIDEILEKINSDKGKAISDTKISLVKPEINSSELKKDRQEDNLTCEVSLKSFIPELKAKPLDMPDQSTDEKKLLMDVVGYMREGIKRKEEDFYRASAEQEKYINNLYWENKAGFLDDSGYAEKLKEYFNSLPEISKQLPYADWSEDTKNIFDDLQNAFMLLAEVEMGDLQENFSEGVISIDAYKEKLQGLLEKFSEYPNVVGTVKNSIEDLKDNGNEATDLFSQNIEKWKGDFRSGVIDAIVSGGNFIDVLRNIADEMAKVGLQWTLFGKNGKGGWLGGILEGLFADGAVFQSGNVIPFARGGVISSPTFFPMIKGTGLMGEAGPEAIMPLKRGLDGKLGVQANGQNGGAVTNVFNIKAVDAKSFVDMLQNNRSVVESMVVGGLCRNGPMRRAVQGAI